MLLPSPANSYVGGGKMHNTFIAKAHVEINAPIAKVWAALVDPALIKHYMFGTNAVSDWYEGAPIVWQGEWEGKPYEDRGVILQLRPERVLQYSHFSPLSGQADVPENYHTVTIELSPGKTGTMVTLSQDNNASEEDREHSEQNWAAMLESLKRFLET
jgi:uncharacterized protein YndB with AHSA1/START domain